MKVQNFRLRQKPIKFDENFLVSLREKGATKKSSAQAIENLFRPYEPIKGVLPASRSHTKIAMDAGFSAENAFSLALLDNVNSTFQEGYAFPGFTVLAQWTQVPEFRRPAEVYAREMTRKWIKFEATGEDDKEDKLKAIKDEFTRLNVQSVMREAIELDGFFGRAQIFIDLGSDKRNDPELLTPLVEDSAKIKKGSLKRLTVVEAIWSYPNLYNADNPLDETFYKPTTWFVMGTEIHSSRLMTIVTRDLPDILKPAYAFAGLSLLQMMKPYVDNWLRTRQSVSDLIHAFTVWVLKTDLSQVTNNGGAAQLFARAQVFNQCRDNHGLNIVDKNSEDFANVSASLAGLDKLQAQAQEQQAAPSGLPLVYLTGITPAGLNASSQDEIEVFQDTCAANQEIYTPFVKKILNIVQLSLFGEIDPEITFRWNPLKVISAADKAQIAKAEKETDIADIDAGVLTAQEVRMRRANDEDSPYAGIDVNEVIEPPEQPGSEAGMEAFNEKD